MAANAGHASARAVLREFTEKRALGRRRPRVGERSDHAEGGVATGEEPSDLRATALASEQYAELAGSNPWCGGDQSRRPASCARIQYQKGWRSPAWRAPTSAANETQPGAFPSRPHRRSGLVRPTMRREEPSLHRKTQSLLGGGLSRHSGGKASARASRESSGERKRAGDRRDRHAHTVGRRGASSNPHCIL